MTKHLVWNQDDVGSNPTSATKRIPRGHVQR
jgi:hypothetical protein